MNKLFRKFLEVAFIVLLGIGLAACGKKTDDTIIGDEYGYLSTFRELNLATHREGYISTEVIKGDILHYIFSIFDAENVSFEYHKYNLNDGADTMVPIPAESIESNEYINGMSVNDDGTIQAFVIVFDRDTYESEYFVKRLDKDFKVLDKYSLSKFITAEDQYVERQVFSNDGTLFVVTAANIIVLDPKGTLVCRCPINGYLNSVQAGSDGKLYFVNINYETWEQELKVMDPGTQTISKVEGFEAGSVDEIFPGLDNTIIFSGESRVKAFNLSTKETKELWNWFEVDAADANYGEIIQTGADEYTVFYEDYHDDAPKTYVINIRRELITADKRKTNLIYGCTYLDYNLKRAITAFNRSNDKYRVVPFICSEEYKENDVFALYMQDVTAGKYDIMDAQSIFADLSVKEGAFADLTDYYKKDIDSSKYNFFDTFDINGKKYLAVLSVDAQAIVSPAKVVGSKTKLSIEDMIELRKQNPNISFIEYGSKENVFYSCFMADAGAYVDFTKATCNFNNESFIKLLEFANTFPMELDYENYDTWELTKKGEILFSWASLGNVVDYQVQKKLMGDDVRIVGYSSEKGSGIMISPNGQIAISAKSKNKDAAWDFIKTLLDEDFQNNLYNVPVLKSAMEKIFEEASTPEYYTDEDGVKREYPKTTYGNAYGDEIEIYAATKEEIDEIRSALLKAEKMPYVDEEIYTIMSEELDSFFKGGKSAKEVADIIQSRVKIYIAEKY